MDQQLLQYIIAQERAGYTEAQIKQVLQQQGRTAKEIDDAFKAARGGELDPIIHDYVQQYARQGSTPVQIFDALSKQGYAPGKVRKAITEVFGPGTMPSEHHTAIFLIIAVVVVIGGLYFLNPGDLIPRGGVEPVKAEEFSLSDQIAQIVIIAREQGTDAAIKECQLRLRNDNRDMCILDIATLDAENGDKVCDQIVDLRLKDTCLMNFIDKDRAGVCKRVSLKENLDTCQTLDALKKPSA